MSELSTLKTLSIKEIKPGMILAGRLLCPEKGGVLLGAGIAITEKVQEVLARKYPDLKLEVIVPLHSDEMARTEEQQSTGAELQVLEKFPKSLIKPSARQGYLDFFHALNCFINNLDGEQEWQGLIKAISPLVKQVEEAPASLQQIVALRLIQDYTLSHAVNTTIYSLFIGRALGLSRENLYSLGLAAAISDVGLLKVPAKIREKSSALSRDEWHLIKQHVNYSIAIARRYRLSEDIKAAILQHHERNDGSGYPFGIKEKDIHPWAQIIAVADTYDAIVSERPYRKAEPAFAATEILMAYSSRLNPKIISVFLKNVSVYPQKGKIMLNNQKKGEIIYLNRLYPDRPIVMVESESDYMGRRYIDLTKDLTIFVEDVE